jgi:hypothetical protein
MPAPFFTRLRTYLDSIGKVLAGQAAVASVFPNGSDIGVSRERIYVDVLKQHIPASCNVFLGGFLFGSDGSESNQVDVIVTTDKALQFNFQNVQTGGKAFASVDGCIGVVSIKSHLSSAALNDALENLASIPTQLPLEGRVNPSYRFGDYEDWPYKVVYASSGVAPAVASAALVTFYDARPDIPETRRPHVIHVAGSYVIVRVRQNVETPDGIRVRSTFVAIERDVDTQALMLVFKNLQENAQNASQVIFSYHHLLEKVVTLE